VAALKSQAYATATLEPDQGAIHTKENTVFCIEGSAEDSSVGRSASDVTDAVNSEVKGNGCEALHEFYRVGQRTRELTHRLRTNAMGGAF
jgi:hypothetical protein